MKQHDSRLPIPDNLSRRIFSSLDAPTLASTREVCRKWNQLACEDNLWKALCLKRCNSLETDPDLWTLIDNNIDPNAPHPWRHIYPKLHNTPYWNSRLQKTGRFVCNLVAHQIAGIPLGHQGLPSTLVVERRFHTSHLQTFILPYASVLYLEPAAECDKTGFDDFIDYLNKRTRAGLAFEQQRRFIFIPPCDYTRTHLAYQGRSLLAVVQMALTPLAP